MRNLLPLKSSLIRGLGLCLSLGLGALDHDLRLKYGDRLYYALQPPSLVMFVPAVASLFCLALPGTFLDMFAQKRRRFMI